MSDEEDFSDLGELRSATRAAVRAEIEHRLGRALTRADEEAMVSLVGSASHWRQVVDVEEALRRAGASLERAFALIPDLREHPLADQYAEIADRAAHPRVRAFASALVDYAHREPWKQSPRSILADEHLLRGPRLWWGPDGPSNRDRALLGLLAGHYPDVNLSDAGMTPEEVIRREAKAIAEARRRARRLPTAR